MVKVERRGEVLVATFCQWSGSSQPLSLIHACPLFIRDCTITAGNYQQMETKITVSLIKLLYVDSYIEIVTSIISLSHVDSCVTTIYYHSFQTLDRRAAKDSAVTGLQIRSSKVGSTSDFSHRRANPRSLGPLPRGSKTQAREK